MAREKYRWVGYDEMPGCKYRYAHRRSRKVSKDNYTIECTRCGLLGHTSNLGRVIALWVEHRMGQPGEPTETDWLLDIGRLLLGLWCDEDMVEGWAACSACPFPDGPDARAEDYLCSEHCADAKKHNPHLCCEEA